jgi:hypothetical protein
MIQSYKVLTTLAAYRVVAAADTQAFTAIYPAAVVAPILGITKDTVKDTTNSIPVAGVGERALLLFNDTATTSSFVAADTAGRGKKWTLNTSDTTTALTSTSYVGILVGPSVSSTGTIAEVYICPGLGKGA